MYFTGTLYWIERVMAVYGGLPFWLAALLNLGLILYLSAFTGLFALGVWRVTTVQGRAAVLAAPFIWVATEIARGYVTGFPWAVLGHSQITALPIAQLASFGGVHSLSWLTAFTSAAVVFAATVPRRRFVPLAVALLTITILAACAGKSGP